MCSEAVDGNAISIAQRVVLSLVCLGAGAAAGSLAAESPAWAGYWAAEPEWCANAAQAGETDPAPIYLADTEMLGLENSCDIISADRVGPPNAWVLDMSCFGEGESYEAQQLILLSGEGAALSMWDGDGLVTLQRCQ